MLHVWYIFFFFATFYPSPLAMHQFPADPSSSWDRKNPSQHCPGHWARVQFLQNGHWQRTVIVTKCHQLFVRSWQILFHEDVSLLKIPVGHDSLCFHRSSSGLFSTAQPSLSQIQQLHFKKDSRFEHSINVVSVLALHSGNAWKYS